MPFEINEMVVRASVESPIRVIEVDSTKLVDDVDGQLESATVIDRLHMPDTFTLIFHDPERDVLDRANIAIGKRVKISTGALTAEAAAVLIDGEVTSIEVEYGPWGSRAIARGYDLSHRLTAGRKSKTYLNATYSDIAKEIAGNANLQTDIEATREVHEHVVQGNQSDLDFLLQLAGEVDYICRVDGDKLLFKKAAPATDGPGPGSADSTEATELVYGTSLLEFSARIAAAAQVSEVKVRGWDPVKKETIIGQADVTASHADLNIKPATLSQSFGQNTLFVVDAAVKTQDEADALAKSKAEQAGGSAYEATAVCQGSSELRAGATVSVTGVDKSLEGKWTISSTRHEFKQGSYQTTVECSGRQDRTLSGLVANSFGGSADANRYFGLAVAIVTNNEDPSKSGRVKLKFPWLDDQVESNWASVSMPGAGPEYGLVWIPQVGDAVIVAFEHGDIEYPIVLGGLWNGKDVAPLGDGLFDAGSVKRSGMVSRKGHKLVFFDADSESGIALLSAKGDFKIALNVTKNEIHIKSPGKLVIEANEIQIKADGGASFEAGGQMKIKGATVALN
jgi:phage protein D